MANKDDILKRIDKALLYFSDLVKNLFVGTDWDETDAVVIIYLKPGSDKQQFSHLMYATGLFTENDEIRVLYKSPA